MGIPFHETVYGHRFFDVQLPKLIQAVNRLAEATEVQNSLTAEIKQQKSATVTTSQKDDFILLCGVMRLENKVWKYTTGVARCESPRSAILWADQALLYCEELGYKPLPEKEASFLQSLLTNSGDMLLVYKGDPKDLDVMALSAKGA